MDIVLGTTDATIDSVFVCDAELLPDTERALVAQSSIRMLMKVPEVVASGFSDGILLVDHTFKIFKERLSLLTVAVHDAMQQGHMVAFGPTSHEDTASVCSGLCIVKVTINKILTCIYTNTMPEGWSALLTASILLKYTPIAQSVATAGAKVVLLCLPTVLADHAQALPNGAIASKLVVKQPGRIVKKTCYAHVVRDIRTNRGKLKNKDLLDGILCDVAYIHECPYLELLHELADADDEDGPMADANGVVGLGPMIGLFIQKYTLMGEDEFVDYMVKHQLYHLWSRGHGMPGEATDTNTLERQHRDLKTPDKYDSVEGFATVLKNQGTAGTRVSRDSKEVAQIVEPSNKHWAKAQGMLTRGHLNLSLAKDDLVIIPSEVLIKDHVPKDVTTMAGCVLPPPLPLSFPPSLSPPPLPSLLAP